MSVFSANEVSYRRRFWAGFLLSLAWAAFLVGTPPPTAQAADPVSISVDATAATDISQLASQLAPHQEGYVRGVPDFQRSSLSMKLQNGGYLWDMFGINYSVWQTVKLSDQSRYHLNWEISCEAQTFGWGRAGIIFGNEDGSNLLSVEVGRGQELRIIRWRSDFKGIVGNVIYSETLKKRDDRIRMNVKYDIRAETLTYAVGDNAPKTLKIDAYTPSAPMTIRNVGWFGGVEGEFYQPTPSGMLNPYRDVPDFDDVNGVMPHRAQAAFYTLRISGD